MWPRLPCCNLPSFHPGNSAFKSPDAFKVSLPLRTNYLYGKIKKTLPELYAFTICLWLRSSASPGIGTPFSYAVPGQANEIVLIEWGNNPLELLINDKVRPANPTLVSTGVDAGERAEPDCLWQPMESLALGLANNRQLSIHMWVSLNAVVEGTCVRV